MLLINNKKPLGFYMEHISIRSLEERDIDFAHQLITIEGWNYSKEDVERMFEYNPSGCFIAEVENQPVGHVFSVNYGKLGWIGLLIVRAEYRGEGFGTLLTKKAMNHLLSRGVDTIRLEARSIVAELYRKLGFRHEYDSLRFSGINRKFASLASSNVKPLERKMMKEIARFDAEYFGANRIKVLTRLYHGHPRFCYVLYEETGIVGYIMCRKVEIGYRIGPWVCNPDNTQAAQELLAKCTETMGRNEKLYAGIPAVNKTAVKISRSFGFEQYSKSIRMCFGDKPETERVEGIFAIGGPEKG